MAIFDISLRQNDETEASDDNVFKDNNFHFRIDENGDLARDETFHSSINVSLFSDRRADSPQGRRGEVVLPVPARRGRDSAQPDGELGVSPSR